MSVNNPKLEFLEPGSLRFDDGNPRFGGQFRDKTQSEIQELIFGAPYFASDLVDSLLENGFIVYEPIVVRKRGNEYVVIEGNRRLAAVKEILANSAKYPSAGNRFERIPAIVFPDVKNDIQDKQARIYLGVRHLRGFREWPPFAKAQFLDRESQNAGGLDHILKEVQIKKQQAKRFLVPFRLLQDAKLGLPDTEDFWVLAEALNRSGVKEFLQLDVDPKTLEIRSYNKSKLKLVMNDLYGPRDIGTKSRDLSSRKVHDTRDLSTYADVLASDKAACELHSGHASLGEAAIYVDTREQSQIRLSKIIKELALLIGKLLGKEKSPKAQLLQQAFKTFESTVKGYLKKDA